MLSLYTRAIQKQESMTGSLFQQKTKFKCTDDYLTTVFHYIHQNPYRAKLVKKMEDYRWSSMMKYAGLTNQNLWRQDIAYQFINIGQQRILNESYLDISDEVTRKIRG